jgi:hypothetical protein
LRQEQSCSSDAAASLAAQSKLESDREATLPENAALMKRAKLETTNGDSGK